MRTAFWASLLLCACSLRAAQPGKVVLPLGGSLFYSTTKSAQTRLVIRTTKGKTYALNVSRDANVPPGAVARNVKIIGELSNGFIIVADSYASKSGGLSLCQAGEEQFLRVISTAQKSPVQTLVLKLASCRSDIELADPGVEWKPDSSTLSVHWLQGPSSKGKAEERSFQISAAGQVGTATN